MKEKLGLVVVFLCFNLTIGQEQHPISITESRIHWKGSNLFKFNEHYGTVDFKKGCFTLVNGAIKGGSFEIDMTTIKNTDGGFNEMLVWHLKNEDFFDVGKYPTSRLKIVEVRRTEDGKSRFKALLTIKDKTNPIEFEGDVESTDQTLVLRSKFILDRTEWGINFNSNGLFDGLKDDIISDAMQFDVTVIARTQ